MNKHTNLRIVATSQKAIRNEGAAVSEEKSKGNDSQSIARAVAILRAVGDKPGSSLGAIAKETGLARSTVQRLVSSLNNEGLLTKSFGQQGVYLGMELARLASKVNINARALLLPLMQELHAKIGDNIDLTVLDGDKVIVVEQIASNEDIRVISFVGKQHPINCTANGKAHLGFLSREEGLDLLRRVSLERFTAKSITDPVKLMDQIDAFREVGLYIDREEYSEGACAVATTLPPFNGRELAVSIAMPTSRFNRREEDLKVALLDFRRTVQNTFGSSL